MIDKCSQATLITEYAAHLLGLMKKSLDTPIKAVGDIVTGTSKQYISLTFETNQAAPEVLQTTALIMSKISQKLPVASFEKNEHWTHLQRVRLADPSYNKRGNIDILLGGDVWDEITLHGLLHRRYGSPTAEKTKLGWILCGKVQKTSEDSTCFMIKVDEEEGIDQQLKRFWQIEEIDTEQRIESVENQNVKTFTTKRLFDAQTVGIR